jgi:2-amino-4-hydroxy-6-hydroxymethyldihydropteridine diphosphokinase
MSLKGKYQYALSLGSNLGDRQANIFLAEYLLGLDKVVIIKRSSFYITEAMDFLSLNYFINCCLLVETDLKPLELLDVTQKVEKELGRQLKSNESYEDRLIDIDIILCDSLTCNVENLIIPHLKWKERCFVVYPILELSDEFNIPSEKINFESIREQGIFKIL